MPAGNVIGYDELQGEGRLPGFQRNAFRVADVLGKDAGFIVRTDDFVEQLQPGDDYRRGIGVVQQQFGAEGGEAVDTAEVHFAVGSAVAGRGVELVALQSVGFGEVTELLRFRIEA